MTVLQDTFKRKNNNIPIWFMRQAGRYLPEYMEIRKDSSDFLELCYDSEKAKKVTLQPIDRFDFDAAIIFSDILVLPHALGWKVAFKKGEGPILQKFETDKDLLYINNDFDKKINCIYDTVNKVRLSLDKNKSLIGFAGSPWTVASYMLEGKGKQDFSVSKNFLYNNKKLALQLIDIITEKTIEYLLGQINAGVDIIQLFDSWAGVLSGEEYEDFVIKPTKKIVSLVKRKYPSLPIIGFPRGSGYLYQEYIDQTDIDAIGVDQFVPINTMKKWQENIIVQGNFDPVLLLGKKEIIEKKANDILTCLDSKNFIFNLGHGILPNTPVENVQFLVNYVRNYQK
ncbi:MAG: uroporphyrinogen decarboxylase [Alphaproteobacteria bacterium]|jgi:uroporphyrinogen decarboxylase|nr:uroporphyrinogen decarboxylase [Alphaproteobacteria bacterium]MCP5362504.1 uroporphyrinogen decarboxylase [Rickettsiaceae bacterium]